MLPEKFTRLRDASAAAIAALSAIAIVVHVAERERTLPNRCPAGMAARAARCCGTGQRVDDAGQCADRALSCAVGMALDERGNCVLLQQRVSFAGGTMSIGATDWEGASQSLRSLHTAAYELDRAEATVARYLICVSAGHCPPLLGQIEPGRPVVDISPTDAARFCAFEGGRLPSSAEWLFAAAGPTGRRYPWGNTGLVCRRAAFGITTGPCAEGGTGPDLAGARPDGATPDGVLDLAGNVAEWAIEPDGSFVARGGSYRSELASELKTWAFEAGRSPAPQVGFRCAYSVADRAP